MNENKIDWTIFERATSALKKDLEEKPEMWDNWTKSDKRYMLVCYPSIVNNNITALSGTVTGHLDFHVSSNSVEDLKLLWYSDFIQQKFDTTRQHFIADMKSRKIIEFMSVCM